MPYYHSYSGTGPASRAPPPVPGSRPPEASGPSADLYARTVRRYRHPNFCLLSTVVSGVRGPVVERVVHAAPFWTLLAFDRLPPDPDVVFPAVLLLPPHAGHCPTLIRDTVAALLVEAKVTSRQLTAHDIDDVMLLVTPSAHKQNTEINWETNFIAPFDLPSTPVRQLLINLVLNAIQAAGQHGHVSIRTYTVDGKEIVFTPEPQFVGDAPAVDYRISDNGGQHATGTYTPTVTAVTPVS